MNRHVTMNLHGLQLHFGLWRAMLEMDVACSSREVKVLLKVCSRPWSKNTAFYEYGFSLVKTEKIQSLCGMA